MKEILYRTKVKAFHVFFLEVLVLFFHLILHSKTIKIIKTCEKFTLKHAYHDEINLISLLKRSSPKKRTKIYHKTIFCFSNSLKTLICQYVNADITRVVVSWWFTTIFHLFMCVGLATKELFHDKKYYIG